MAPSWAELMAAAIAEAEPPAMMTSQYLFVAVSAGFVARGEGSDGERQDVPGAKHHRNLREQGSAHSSARLVHFPDHM